MKRFSKPMLVFLSVVFVFAALWLQVQGSSDNTVPTTEAVSSIKLWEPLFSDTYAPYEKLALIMNVFVEHLMISQPSKS